MQVKLIDFTGAGSPDPLYAARLLVFTKNTRLQMTPDGLETFASWTEEQLLVELDYMAGTIPSSWEFVELKFIVTGLSRGTAQQVTRTRNAAFAMQSQRVTDMSSVTWDIPPSVTDEVDFNLKMRCALDDYKELVEAGVSLEDARDVLPIGVHCNLVAKYDLRAFVELVRKRESLRVQGPYVEMVALMKAEVLRVWPWAETFFIPKNVRAIAMIEAVAQELATGGAMYKGPAGKLAKAADLLK